MPESANVVLTLAVLAWVLWSQLRVRPARTRQTLSIVILMLGIASLYAWNLAHPLSHGAILLIATSLVFLAIGLGVLRAYTVRLWLENGQLMRQGTWLTAALWIVGIAGHFLLEGASGASSASALLYLGLTLLAQGMVLRTRAARLPA